MQTYSDPTREHDPHALPDVEVFYMSRDDFVDADLDDWRFEMLDREMGEHREDLVKASKALEGWYWWSCFPGCLPDGEPNGPFATEQEAIADARDADEASGDDYTQDPQDPHY